MVRPAIPTPGPDQSRPHAGQEEEGEDLREMREQERQRGEDQRREACRAQATGRATSSGDPRPRGYRRQGQGAVPAPRSPACTRPTHGHASLHCHVLPPATPQALAPASLLQRPNPPPLTLLPRTPTQKNSSLYRPTPGGPPLPHLPTRPPSARQLCRAVSCLLHCQTPRLRPGTWPKLGKELTAPSTG